jgi:hypothetical protein
LFKASTERWLSAALERLANHGIPLGNQSVLLAGVNDDLETMRMQRGFTSTADLDFDYRSWFCFTENVSINDCNHVIAKIPGGNPKTSARDARAGPGHPISCGGV